MALSVPPPDWLNFPSAVRFVAPLDANEVRLALLRAAEDGTILLRGAPTLFDRDWREFNAPDDPLWVHGVFFLEGQHGRMTKFEPEIWRASLLSLFGKRDSKLAAEKLNSRKRGRPTYHDWDSALKFLTEYYAINPLPAVKTRVIEQLKEWFVNNDGGKAPDEHDIRTRIVDVLYRGK